MLTDGAGKTDYVLSHVVDLFVCQTGHVQYLAIEIADILFAGHFFPVMVRVNHTVDS